MSGNNYVVRIRLDIKQQVAAECEDQSLHDQPEATEGSHLLCGDQSNGVQNAPSRKKRYIIEITLEKEHSLTEQEAIAPALEGNNRESITPELEGNNWDEPDRGSGGKSLCWSLNRRVTHRLRLWMILVPILLVIIIIIIMVALALWSVSYVDEDDEFDRGSFVVPLFYSGSLTLPNQPFTQDLLSPTSNRSRALSSKIEEELTSLYSSSPALGRYFSGAGLHSFRNGSVTAYYWLKFLMPLEHDQLLRYTLSREMVYNVLRQHLYDQELAADSRYYIDLTAISMQAGNGTLNRD
ncbi:hypothetical protein GJAV_G00057500 [Gymnothorax javanicus]|nr:hypothetical protein GJAV_G00057500 [Gymnothorax javanicus]